MPFENLTTTTQDLIYTQYHIFGKFFIFFLLFAFSLFYLFIWKPHFQKKSPFVTVFAFRMIAFAVAFSTLILSPLFIFFFSPDFSLWDFSMFLLFFVRISMGFFVTFLVDVFVYGFLILMRRTTKDTYLDKYFNFKEVKQAEKIILNDKNEL